MFSLRDFVKKGLIDAIGKMADYQVVLNAAGWLEKSVLSEDDLAEIDAIISAQHLEEEASESDYQAALEEMGVEV